MPHLLIILNPDDPDARLAAGVLLSTIGPGRLHRADLPLPPLRRLSVLFVGEPLALTLAIAMQDARAVAVVAKHAIDIAPLGVLWASGPTLEQAAKQSVGFI